MTQAAVLQGAIGCLTNIEEIEAGPPVQRTLPAFTCSMAKKLAPSSRHWMALAFTLMLWLESPIANPGGDHNDDM